MDVVRESFAASLDDIIALIKKCEFYAIDLEMTGIRLNDEPEDPTMSVAQFYDIKRRVAQKFNIIQVGVCLFEPVAAEDKDKDSACATSAASGAAEDARSRNWTNFVPDASRSYIARPFNFYVFPSDNEASGGREVVLDADTLGFLRRHKMDFQKWIYAGVSCCTREGEAAVRRAIAEGNAAAGDSDSGRKEGVPQRLVSLSNAADREWVEEGVQAATQLDCAVAASSSGKAVSREVVLKPTKSSHARQVLKDHLTELFPHISVTSRGRFPNRDVVLTKLNPDEARKAAADAAEKRERELVDRIGFRHIFNALVASKKPCVGHNCFADMLFLYSTFERPLPDSVAEFRARYHEMFPLIFDTKHIARSPHFDPARFANSALGALHDDFSSSPQRCDVRLPLGFHAYSPQTLVKASRSAASASAAHEAGYDALMTGVVFLNMVRELGPVSIASRANHLAIFRSLFSLALEPGVEDEFTPGAKPVLLVDHPGTIRYAEVESVISGIVACEYATNVNDTRTLVVLASPDAEALRLGELSAAVAKASRHSLLIKEFAVHRRRGGRRMGEDVPEEGKHRQSGDEAAPSSAQIKASPPPPLAAAQSSAEPPAAALALMRGLLRTALLRRLLLR